MYLHWPVLYSIRSLDCRAPFERYYTGSHGQGGRESISKPWKANSLWIEAAFIVVSWSWDVPALMRVIHRSSAGMSTSSWMILNIIVSWYLARLVSKVSHSRCLSMDVMLLVFLYQFVTYLAAYMWMYHLKLIDVILGVWAPGWAAVLQYGSYKWEVCSSLHLFITDFQISPQEALHAVSFLDSLVDVLVPWHIGLYFHSEISMLSPQLLRHGLWEFRCLNVDSWILRFSVCYIYLDGRPCPTFSPILHVDASPLVGFWQLYDSLSFCTVCSLLKVHFKS